MRRHAPTARPTGFTLIEVMIVVAIVAILAAIALPSYNEYIRRGHRADARAGLLQALATLPAHPDSVPINRLVRVAGTPLAGQVELDPFEFVRVVAAARILMPASMLRLSAGREQMSDELQALCLFAGANSIFHGERLLTTANPAIERDRALFARLGVHALPGPDAAASAGACGCDCGSAAA